MADLTTTTPEFDIEDAILTIAALSCPNVTRDRHNQRLEDDRRARDARAKTQRIRDARIRQDIKEVACAKGEALLWRLRNVDRVVVC